MSWYVNWFDSPYYHILYKNRDVKEAKIFIDNLIDKLRLKSEKKLIDIGCGTGRHSSYFNKKGMDVIGIDLSRNNIAKAKEKENENLQFTVHDMREVFNENYFDIAVNLFTSFGYFEKKEDEQKTINSMAKNLKKEGLLIIDFMNVKKVIHNLVLKETKEINGIVFNISREFDKNYIIKNIYFSDNNKQYHFQEKVKALTLSTFSVLLNKAGLKIIDTFGDYNLKDFNATFSERLILICKK